MASSHPDENDELHENLYQQPHEEVHEEAEALARTQKSGHQPEQPIEPEEPKKDTLLDKVGEHMRGLATDEALPTQRQAGLGAPKQRIAAKRFWCSRFP
jgi:hypothetical protein